MVNNWLRRYSNISLRVLRFAWLPGQHAFPSGQLRVIELLYTVKNCQTYNLENDVKEIVSFFPGHRAI